MNDLTDFAEVLAKLASNLQANGNKARFSAAHGWPYSPLNVDDLGAIATSLASRVAAVQVSSLDDQLKAFASRLNEESVSARDSLVPQIFSSPHAPESLLGLFYAIEAFLSQAGGGSDLKVVAGLALKLRNRASTATERLESVMASMEGIEKKLETIQTAHDAAEELPVTQRMLNDALNSVEGHKKNILKAELEASASTLEMQSAEARIKQSAATADDYLDKIKGAYRAVTSQGLAQAFHNREAVLHRSMLIWVLGLISSLLIAGIIANDRFPHITAALKGSPDWGVVAAHVTLAALGLSPAVWFAWVSTTQIGQRFRLAEDYAYKASISAAYEGYRTEAANLDPLLQAQLFASALGRLDELPLRLIDSKVAGSPLHELLKSVEFKQASEAFPELLERVFSVLRRTPDKKSKTDASPAPESD